MVRRGQALPDRANTVEYAAWLMALTDVPSPIWEVALECASEGYASGEQHATRHLVAAQSRTRQE